MDSQEPSIGQLKQSILDHYADIQSQIDIRTETLLLNLPEALEKSRGELLERIKDEKEKNLSALADDSPLMRQKNECYEKFVQLKQEYLNCGNNDQARKEEIQNSLEVLKKDVGLIEEFLEDFKNRTLCFDQADKSVFASLIGELVTAEDDSQHENFMAN